MADLILFVFALLIVLVSILAYSVGVKIGTLKTNRKWEMEIPLHRKNAIEKSRAILSGQFSEQIAPYFPDFPFKPTECKFLGKPVDFIVFPGLERKSK
jgi:predicted Holliday junction resolvase-like endonuclease